MPRSQTTPHIVGPTPILIVRDRPRPDQFANDGSATERPVPAARGEWSRCVANLYPR